MRRAAVITLVAVWCVASSASAEERKPRVVIHYDRDGQIARQEVDTTGAGRATLWVHYERGVMVRQEEDTVGDGRPHVWTSFREGRAVRQGTFGVGIHLGTPFIRM